MSEFEQVTIKVNADTTDALAKLRELRGEAEPLAELLETKRDWLPYLLAAGGWLFALVEWITR